MKDNLFEMLLHLFEKSMTQLQKIQRSIEDKSPGEEEFLYNEDQPFHVKSAQQNSIRIFTQGEQYKLTKASYQFLMRMKLWKIIDVDLFELVINQLQFSESPIITLQETKWTIRNILMNHLNQHQLAFLDLVLYQAEDNLRAH